MRQLIIARKDLQMSPGKLAAQCCHASLASSPTPSAWDRDVEPIREKRRNYRLSGRNHVGESNL
jgi:Peptidyl-tRNA hydrolase PTH2